MLYRKTAIILCFVGALAATLPVSPETPELPAETEGAPEIDGLPEVDVPTEMDGASIARIALRAVGLGRPILKIESNLAGTPPTTREGYFTLSWPSYQDLTGRSHGDHRYLLIESRNVDFRKPALFLDHTDHSIAISGKLNGDLYYRVFLLEKGGETASDLLEGISPESKSILEQYPEYSLTNASPSYQVHVEHYSLTTAFSYFGAGAFLFVFTAAVIIIGTRRTREES